MNRVHGSRDASRRSLHSALMSSVVADEVEFFFGGAEWQPELTLTACEPVRLFSNGREQPIAHLLHDAGGAPLLTGMASSTEVDRGARCQAIRLLPDVGVGAQVSAQEGDPVEARRVCDRCRPVEQLFNFIARRKDLGP